MNLTKNPDAEKDHSGAAYVRSTRLIRAIYLSRVAAFAYCAIIVGFTAYERGRGGLFLWLGLVLSFFVYPHVIFWRAMRAAEPGSAEAQHIVFDIALLGFWAGQIGFALWPSFGLLSGALMNAATNFGAAMLMPALALFFLTAGVVNTIFAVPFQLETGFSVMVLSIIGCLGYTSLIGVIMHAQTARVVRAREDLRRSEQRYRMITENAGDLIAMLDINGRWRYTSPSWNRLLLAKDLLPGVDATIHMHADDAVALRGMLRRLADGEGRLDMQIRLHAADGIERRLECGVHPVADGLQGASYVVLIGREVSTQEKEGQGVAPQPDVLAFENTTEAILISDAGGLVVSVNKSFTRITGFSAADVVGKLESRIRLAVQPPVFYAHIDAEVARVGHWAGAAWARRKDGSLYREWRTVSAVRDEAGVLVYTVSVFFEMESDQRAA
jgi:PAS domain S-box-containing protein